MSVEYRTGDLFEQTDVDAFAHGVNCKGVMGAGIAPQFKVRWPEMHRQYRWQCAARLLRPGGLFMWMTPSSPNAMIIFNLATQDQPGANATYQSLSDSVDLMLSAAERLLASNIALPRIGCGIGGLEWPRVKQILSELSAESNVNLVVVSRPGDPE